MRFTLLIAAAFASTAFAVPTSPPVAGPGKLTKRNPPCGQFYDRQYVEPVNKLTQNLIGSVLGDGACQNLDNANMTKTFTFELVPRCEWCRFWRYVRGPSARIALELVRTNGWSFSTYNCAGGMNGDATRDRLSSEDRSKPYWSFNETVARSFQC
jgi:hypothetical protein